MARHDAWTITMSPALRPSARRSVTRRARECIGGEQYCTQVNGNGAPFRAPSRIPFVWALRAAAAGAAIAGTARAFAVISHWDLLASGTSRLARQSLNESIAEGK